MDDLENKIYYEDEKIQIRNMQQKDARIITDEELAQGQYADCCNDDDLVLYLSKSLKHSPKIS